MAEGGRVGKLEAFVLSAILREAQAFPSQTTTPKQETQLKPEPETLKIQLVLEFTVDNFHTGWANSFICLIEIQAKNAFCRVFASAIGETFVFPDDLKTAFLQHSYRPAVVRCYPGENRPSHNKAEHPIERLSR